jgi:Peptidase family M1 domain
VASWHPRIDSAQHRESRIHFARNHHPIPPIPAKSIICRPPFQIQNQWLPNSSRTTKKPNVPAQHGVYDPRETFAPLTLPSPVNGYRSADGTPGPAYWQNRADYKIAADLDPTHSTLTGDETITYINNSPIGLDSLWLQLDQNVYREDARARFSGGRLRSQFTRGFALDLVEVERDGRTAPADAVVSDTRLQIRLPEALAPHGRQLHIHIRYHYEVPGEFGGRTAHAMTKNGEIFDIAQWYPRMAVYDDLHGWDTLPYLGSEFYLDYGDFDYAVTVPSDMLVAGSGTLMNPQDVLTEDQRQHLNEARASDKTVMIRPLAEVTDPNSRPTQSGTLTWRFHMENTRDVSFSASRAFIWDGARINLPDGKTSLAMSFYPEESAGPDAWGRSTEYLKHAVENFSRRWSAYPYPAAVNVAGPVGGMEYPGIVFDDIKARGKDLFWITAHEIGHTWFPMVVGVNERRNQWMDEGFNTFIDVYESDDFRAYGPKRDMEYAQGGGNPVDEILPLLRDPEAPVMVARADQINPQYSHPLSYFKSALGLVLLREQILGPDRFDWAFRKFIRDWSYKHPSPSDFFRAMESAGGEDLSWFWRGWYMNNWTLDLAVQSAAPAEGSWSKGAVVTIANLKRLVMPATVEIAFRGGTQTRIRLPAEAWIQKKTVEIHLKSTLPITSVTIDPDHVIPDNDRTNNVLKRHG